MWQPPLLMDQTQVRSTRTASAQTGSETLALYGAADGIPGSDSFLILVRPAILISVHQ